MNPVATDDLIDLGRNAGSRDDISDVDVSRERLIATQRLDRLVEPLHLGPAEVTLQEVSLEAVPPLLADIAEAIGGHHFIEVRASAPWRFSRGTLFCHRTVQCC